MYNVAFVYTRAARGYEGCRTWTSFQSKEDFDKYWQKNSKLREKERILEEGISEERCIELTRETPHACRVAAAWEEAIDRRTGIVNPHILHMQLMAGALLEVLEASNMAKIPKKQSEDSP